MISFNNVQQKYVLVAHMQELPLDMLLEVNVKKIVKGYQWLW